MTVGTGVDTSENKIRSLAHGLLTSIRDKRPDKIVFFGSKKSKKTLSYLYKEAKKKNFKIPNHKFIEIIQIDDFNHCFKKIENEMKKYLEDEVIVDYTSGTKTMASTAAIVAVLYKKELMTVTGNRDTSPIVQMGTEETKTQNMYRVYDGMTIKRFKELFNLYRFRTALKVLDEVIVDERKEPYTKLTKGYLYWDLFNHQKAQEYLSSEEIKVLAEIKDVLNRNKSILGSIVRAKNGKTRYKYRFYLPDILANSQRRAHEGKYDDAVARVYRALELIAQIIFEEEYKDYTFSINPKNYSKRARSALSLDSKRPIGLKKAYQLLACEGHEIGKKFINDKRLQNLLKLRNHSIFAHGLESIKREEYKEFYEKVISYAKMVDENIESKIKAASFPKLMQDN